MNTKKPWSGRFSGATDAGAEQFTASCHYDQRLAQHDIAGSCAHAAMLARIGVLTRAEAATIIAGLKRIAQDIERGLFRFRAEREDVHMNIEAALAERIGPLAGKLHTGRSRNDQVALDERLYLRDILAQVQAGIAQVQQAFVDLAAANKGLIMPGLTHTQHAMPVLAAHHLLSYVEMLERDRERFADAYKRVNILPLGAAALAGSGFALDRAFVARTLGFDGVAANSMDAVADRDYLLEFLSAAAVLGMHLSRMAEDMILWVSREFGFAEIGDAFCTGSSLMPNKKNPDVLELIRGKCGRLYGNLVALLTVMKGLPMTYNRDMQEDKEPGFDSADTVLACLRMLAALTPTIRFRADRIAAAVCDDFLLATDWADYLVRKGVPFREAHELVGTAVKQAVQRGCGLTQLPLPVLQAISKRFDAGVLKLKSAAGSVAAKQSVGSTQPAMVQQAVKQWQRALAKRRRAGS